jgi:5'-nucleotidase
MHLLLTNDDGYKAPGILALYRAIPQEHRISVVAPASERSSCGHAASLSGAIRVNRVKHDMMGEIFAVDGTPVDCVRLACSELIDERMDWVISGINRGANVSVVDVHTSGTVAGAREAAMCGMGGIAVSQMFLKGRPIDWERASQIFSSLLPQLVEASHEGVKLWNVNFPALPPSEQPRGICVVPLAHDHIPLAYEQSAGDGGRQIDFEYGGYFETRTMSEGTDLASLFEGKVVITPLCVDATERTLPCERYGFRL